MVTNLSRNSAIYIFTSFVSQGLSLALLPAFTHFLSPDDYGIFALTNTIGSLLVVIMTLGMQSALTRFYFDSADEAERKNMLGTITIAVVIASFALALLVELTSDQLRELPSIAIPYNPYIRLVVWTTFLRIFSVISLALVRCREQAHKYAILTITPVLLYNILGLVAVGVFHWQVVGLLIANLIVTLLMLPVNMLVIRPEIHLFFSTSKLKAVLSYSLPLVPHTAAGWALAVSDRLVMQAFLPLAKVGIYSVGYTVGGITQTVSSGVNTAWQPMFFRSQSESSNQDSVIRAATYLLAGTSFFALSLTVASWHFINWFLPSSYSDARSVVFWVSMSGVFVLLSWFWSVTVHYSKKTAILPVITVLSGALNIGLNIWLIPMYGMQVAAITTMVAFAVEAFLNALASNNIYPIRYDYMAWSKIVGVTLLLAAVSNFRPVLSPGFDIVFSLSVFLSMPGLFVLLGVVKKSDEAIIQRQVRIIGTAITAIFNKVD